MLRRVIGGLGYSFAFLSIAVSAGWILFIHAPHWALDDIFLGAPVFLAAAPFLFLGFIFWGIGCVAWQQPRLDIGLIIIYVAIGFAFWVLPSRFSME
ncbi:hypothetical protein [Acidovorax sp. NCPPB 4044]|uniref:hypothetical protein n=1 Tax=Acidovorax sp. NCPPB 4044 TaxID=2940490 RepID=UPI002303FCB0|nr:hypothetical protein [Acidovorax sp. NCPPB 4044]MDA8519607.1 hypothetical protein [Acidovorax sp. NCPPB 4044]